MNKETKITEYNPVEAGLQELKTRLKGVVYDVTTTAGMDIAKKDRRELVTLRTSLEAKRVEIKAPALEHCRLIDAEAARIKAELVALESPIDLQIKAEEKRKEEEKAEKARLAAEAQRALDDKIIEISKLPLRCVNKTSEEIQIFLDAITAKEIGGEFTGETRDRAEAAKATAVDEIQLMLDAAITLEESARVAEAERKEREEQQAKEDLERANQDRILKEQQEKLRLQQEEFNRQQEVARKEREEQDRILREEREKQDAETRRQQEEQAAQEKERDRLIAEENERKRAQAEKERREAEKKLRLEKARCKTAVDALKEILAVVNDTEREELVRLDQVRDICEANING